MKPQYSYEIICQNTRRGCFSRDTFLEFFLDLGATGSILSICYPVNYILNIYYVFCIKQLFMRMLFHNLVKC